MNKKKSTNYYYYCCCCCRRRRCRRYTVTSSRHYDICVAHIMAYYQWRSQDFKAGGTPVA